MKRPLWPAIVGIACLLFSTLVCACGLFLTASQPLSDAPLLMPDGSTLPAERLPVLLAINTALFVLIAVTISAVGAVIWWLYGRAQPPPRVRARAIALVTLVFSLSCCAWGLLAAVTTAALGVLPTGESIPPQVGLLGFLVCLIPASLLLFASVAIWILLGLTQLPACRPFLPAGSHVALRLGPSETVGWQAE